MTLVEQLLHYAKQMTPSGLGGAGHALSPAKAPMLESAADEIKRLTLENWQLKGALGYEVPGDIPEGDFKCGLCDARRRAFGGAWPPDAEPIFEK